MRYLLASFFLSATSVAMCQWTHVYTTPYNPTNHSSVVYSNRNDSGTDWHNIGFSVTFNYTQRVTGSTLTPPWTTPFTPLSTSIIPLQITHTGWTIPNGYTLKCTVTWKRDVRTQEWSRPQGQFLEVAVRERYWEFDVNVSTGLEKNQ